MRFTFLLILLLITTISWSQMADEDSVAVNTDPQELVDFKIYPNPVKDRIYFESDRVKNDFIITFYDVLGKLVLKERINVLSMRQGMDVSNLKRGVYLVKVEDGQNTVTQKLIKN